MQETSELYKHILTGPHRFETRVTIDGNTLTEDKILACTRDRKGFMGNLPSIGGALAATLELKVIKPSFSIPKMATITVQIRVVNDGQQSEWLNAGTYFIDQRETTDGEGDADNLTIIAYDAMLKAEADYPDTNHDWPYRDTLVVAEIAQEIGVTVDPRVATYLTTGDLVELPASYTMRETLEHIASANAGNFFITNDNTLMFAPLYGLDYVEQGSYLADENGNALMFGNEGWFVFA